MISIQFTDDNAAQARLRTIGDTLKSGIARAVAKLGIDLQNNVQQSRLRGQVLQVRSGLLKQGIGVRVEQSVAAVTATVGGDVGHAAAQQFWSTGTMNVRASLRRIKIAFGRPITATTIGIGGYSRRMDLLQRSFLRSTLVDLAPFISERMEDALRAGLE